MTAPAPSELACPRCAGPLDAAADGRACPRCAVRYPDLGPLPCLVPDPALYRAQWGLRLEEYLGVTKTRLAQIDVERAGDDLAPRTRTRLIRIMRAVEVEREAIGTLLAPVAAAVPAAAAVGIPAGTPQGDLAVLKCYENVFRDWAWGDRESAMALGLVQRLAAEASASAPLGSLAVFGAGAARLAVDVHRTLGPQRTLALDINPLPLLIAAALLAGETLQLHEFPVAPHGEQQVAVPRTLRCPWPVREGLTLLLGDGLRPPFAPASLDVALTAWYVDATAADLRATVAALNRALRPGGLWINFGPLRFAGPLARAYTIEEARDIVVEGGFRTGAELREEVPYFASPDSGSHRVETVFGFAARKVGAAPDAWAQDAFGTAEPAWAADPTQPIPALPELAALRRTAVFTGGLISLVDGRRSITDLAAALGQSWGVEPQALVDRLRAFLPDLLRR